MKLLTFIQNHQPYRLGIKTEEGILDLQSALPLVSAAIRDAVPLTIHEVIEGGQEALNILHECVEAALGADNPAEGSIFLEEDSLTLGPCVTHPSKIICVGLNYRKHAEETSAPIPAYPILFNKFNNTLTGHGHDVPLPRTSSKVDYEAELAIVIGKTAKYVSKENALEYVFGYCNANDLSARDLQMRTPQWMLGKSCDKFSPLGPYLVTSDEVGDPNALDINCTVNGQVRQQSNTSNMIFPCDEIVSYISQYMTLNPGDIILTGTPEGVVLGYPVEHQIYLKHGDVVKIEIEKLGSLTNRMIDEKEI